MVVDFSNSFFKYQHKFFSAKWQMDVLDKPTQTTADNCEIAKLKEHKKSNHVHYTGCWVLSVENMNIKFIHDITVLFSFEGSTQ